MKLILLAFTLGLLPFAAGPGTSQEELTARQIMDLSDESRRSDDGSSVCNFTLVSKRGKVTERKFEAVSKQISDTEERRFLKFTEPGDIKGTILLTYDHEDKDDDTWLFLPALGKPRRISSSDKTDSFVGSDLTFEDLANVNLDANDFTLLRSEEYNGHQCYVVESKPGSVKEKKESGYSKKIFWVDHELFLLHKAELYDKKKKKLLKVLSLDDIRKIEGTEKHRPYKWKMENVQKGSKTLLEYTSIKLNIGVPDKSFSQRVLK